MISVYKRDSDANSNALSQDTAFNGIKASIDKRVKSSAKKNSVFAGDLNLSDSTASRIEQKRNGARKQAKKLIQDAWDKDTKALGSIQDMEKDKADKVNEITDLKAKAAYLEKDKKAAAEEYGIDPDSQEQKDLELLEKYQNNKAGVENSHFSEDEVNRLKELQNEPLTDYQKQVLKFNASKNAILQDAGMKEEKVISMHESINLAKLDMLKSQTMIKADDVADAVIDAAEDEIFGMLIADGKEKLDEDAKETQEKADDASQKREEREEKIEENRQERKEQEEILSKDADADKLEQNLSLQKQTDNNITDVQKNIQRMIKEKGLVNEDIKGIEIDLNF